MPRVIDSEVKEILPPTTIDTTPFILTASLLVDSYLAASGLPESQLAEIERWWAAHLVTIREPLVQRSRIGETDTTFIDTKGVLAKGLESSLYGQTVLMLDSSGTLVSLAQEAEAGLKAASFDVD